jgi:antibiotic biosynthesis monooxygenase (ABM) superfamily enzyme
LLHRLLLILLLHRINEDAIYLASLSLISFYRFGMDKSKAKLSEEHQEGPVTVSIARKVKKGFEKKYEEWERDVRREASQFQGYIGTNFLRPSAGTQNKYIIIYRFDSYANACRWEDSDKRQAWLSKIEPMLEGEALKQKQTGLEVWFELPEMEVDKPAPRYKMAIVLTVVLYMLSISLNLILRPVLELVSLPVNILIILVINVLLMTYLIMPKVNYLLKDWLYK